MKRTLILALALAGCPETDETTPPGPLEVGLARVRIPAPVGIGTVGFGGFGVGSEPSPFADRYPATNQIHGHPEFKVVVVSRGPGHEVIFVRADTVGVFQHLRQSVLDELVARTGVDYDDALLMGGTHTHSGPGRVIDGGGPFDLIADTFFPEFYDRLVDALADAIEAALADLGPGRVGRGLADAPDGHNDRRCEDGLDYTNDALPMLVVEKDDAVAAVIMAYSVHGTVLGIDRLTLSQDVSGAIEQAVEDGFDHPVEALMFNSWGADMAPGDPEVPLDVGSPLPDGYRRMEEVGLSVSDAVHTALADVVWEEDPVVAFETHRVRLDRASIGYDDDTFEYDYGGVYCGASAESDCDVSTTVDDLDESCLAFPETFPAPNQTILSAGQIGGLHLVTFPGEPGTILAEEVLAAVGVWPDVPATMFLGYAQDYTGYSILEEDWWQGGYEASGAMWGPLQGEYLKNQAIWTYSLYRLPGRAETLLEPAPVPGFETDYTPRTPTTALNVGSILQDAPTKLSSTDVLTFTVAGSDPWLGAPRATLVREDDTPVLRANGVAIDSDDYTFWIALATDPSYDDSLSAPEREFQWSFHLPITREVAGFPDLSGRMKLRVELPQAAGEPLVVDSAVFEVVPPL
jgi:hypothetical protein